MTAHLIAQLRTAGCVGAEDEARLLLASATSPAALQSLVELRVAGHPLEHVLGYAEFCGLRIAVDPGVFIPRVRTGHLVRQALELLRPGDVVVDLCCGSGAIGAALLSRCAVDLHSTDVDPVAVRCARRNVARVHEGDLFAALPPELRGRVDLIVANAPYVPSAAIALLPAEARLHEHLVALDGGADGFDVHRRLAAEVETWLRPGGHLLVETSERQAARSTEVFEAAGLTAWAVHDPDLEATAVISRASSSRA